MSGSHQQSQNPPQTAMDPQQAHILYNIQLQQLLSLQQQQQQSVSASPLLPANSQIRAQTQNAPTSVNYSTMNPLLNLLGLRQPTFSQQQPRPQLIPQASPQQSSQRPNLLAATTPTSLQYGGDNSQVHSRIIRIICKQCFL